MRNPAESWSLDDYVDVCRRQVIPIVVAWMAVVGTAVGWATVQPAQYAAEVQVLMAAQTPRQIVGGVGYERADVARELENELRFARSPLVVESAEREVGGHVDLAVSGESKSADLLIFRATGDAAEEVAAAANVYARQFIDLRAERILEASAQTRVVIERQIQRLSGELAQTAGRDVERREALSEQLALYEQFDSGIDLVGELASASSAQILSGAAVPDEEVGVSATRVGILAAALGLAMGVGLAFLLDSRDDRLRTRSQIESLTQAPMLGSIPSLRRGAGDVPVSVADGDEIGEAFRNLRTAVKFADIGSPTRIIQVTSSRSSEGKTTIACQLSIAIARSGSPVVLVDCDLRNPTVSRRFRLAARQGLTNVMAGEAAVEDSLQAVEGCPGLVVLPAGPTPANAADFLWPVKAERPGGTLEGVLRTLAASGYTVVVDSPPVLPVADSLTIARAVDATLFVVARGTSRVGEVEEAFTSLGYVGASILGTVLNRSSSARRYGYPVARDSIRMGVSVDYKNGDGRLIDAAVEQGVAGSAVAAREIAVVVPPQTDEWMSLGKNRGAVGRTLVPGDEPVVWDGGWRAGRPGAEPIVIGGGRLSSASNGLDADENSLVVRLRSHLGLDSLAS